MSVSRSGQSNDAATATVVGVAAGLFTTVSLLLGVWLAAVFFVPVLLGVFVASVMAARSAAKRLELPRLWWSQIILTAVIVWPVAAALPYVALKGEVHLRVDLPRLPADAMNVKIRATPLSGGSMHGPAPGIVAEYWTSRPQDVARNDLVESARTPVVFQEERLSAMPDPRQGQVVTRAEGSGTRVRLGVFGNYTSALPWVMFSAAWGWIAVILLIRPPQEPS